MLFRCKLVLFTERKRTILIRIQDALMNGLWNIVFVDFVRIIAMNSIIDCFKINQILVSSVLIEFKSLNGFVLIKIDNMNRVLTALSHEGISKKITIDQRRAEVDQCGYRVFFLILEQIISDQHSVSRTS